MTGARGGNEVAELTAERDHLELPAGQARRCGDFRAHPNAQLRQQVERDAPALDQEQDQHPNQEFLPSPGPPSGSASAITGTA